MDFKSQYADRYKKDLCTETFRAKVARRRSLTQKENRHKQFRKSRRLVFSDVNITPVKENDESHLEAGGVITSKKDEKAQHLADRLRRFKEEKQLRKLKEQREKAKKGVFKCGLYKHDDAPLAWFMTMQHAVPVKPEKPALPSEMRITRLMARNHIDQTLKTSRMQQPVADCTFSSRKGNVDCQVQPARAQSTASRKQLEKERKVFPAATHTRTTRAALATTAKPLPNVSAAAVPKPVLKAVPGNQPQRTTAPKEKEKATDAKAEKLERQKDELPSRFNLPQPDLTILEKETAPLKKTRERSFAPVNFQFQPMDGLSTFKFNPMTPHSTNAFLTPCFSWSPAKKDPVSKDLCLIAKEEDAPVCISALPVPSAIPCIKDVDYLNSPEKECLSEIPHPVPSLPSVPEINSETEVCNASEIKHDVNYFRGILRTEIERLTLLCARWDQSIALEVPEEARALIRTTVGQTRLLMTERFKQFEGLVDDCEFKQGEKETTCTDLDGFWDMVNFQIEDVLNKFANLSKLQDNCWQQEDMPEKKVTQKKIVPRAKTKSSQQDDGRAAARNRLAALKAELKKKMKQEDKLPEASDLGAATEDVGNVVFDAVFFRVESPAKCAQRSSSKAPRTMSTQDIAAKLNTSEVKVANPGTVEYSDLSSAEDHSVQIVKDLHDPQTPVKRVLFGNTADIQSIAREEEACPIVEQLDPATVTTNANVVDYEEHLLADDRFSPPPSESHRIDIFKLGTAPGVNGTDPSAYPVAQDIVMNSQEKHIQPSTKDTSMAEDPEMLEEHEPDWLPRNTALDVSCDPLDFWRNGTPPNLTRSQANSLVMPGFGSVVQANDLIVFSPVATSD